MNMGRGGIAQMNVRKGGSTDEHGEGRYSTDER